LKARALKQFRQTTKPFSDADAGRRKRAGRYVALNEFGEQAMTTKTNIVKYLAFRTAAFIGLTAVSTAVMALPYLA